MRVPILLTWGRVILVPIFVGIYYLPNVIVTPAHRDVIGAVIFALAALTDYLDGLLARLLKQESSFGAFLDPVADKAIVATSLIVLVSLHRTFMFVAVVIIIREIAISALREWMAQLNKQQSVAVVYLGKLKTGLQMFAIWLLLLSSNDSWLNYVGNVFMLLAIIITILSMFYYLEQAKKYL